MTPSMKALIEQAAFAHAMNEARRRQEAAQQQVIRDAVYQHEIQHDRKPQPPTERTLWGSRHDLYQG